MTTIRNPCRQCKWIAKTRDFCTHPMVGVSTTDFVSGRINQEEIHCQQARTIGQCNPSGQYWEPNP